jgi:TrmH family RNA methyltransferase
LSNSRSNPRDLPSRFERRKPQDPVTRRDQAHAFEETWRPPNWFERISVVLVEPTDSVNIGGVIRVMANTGFLKLRLVNPAVFDRWELVGVAHYTQHIIDSSTQFSALPEALADTNFSVGLTGRHTRAQHNALGLSDAVQQIIEAAQRGQQVAIVFGREDRGLNNEMLDHCQAITTIPTNPAYPSLNLAQAALLVLYQVFQRANGLEQTYRPPRRQAPAASAELLEDLIADLERALDGIEFLKTRSREHAMRSLRVALFRARLNVREASLLRAIFIELRRFLHRRGVLDRVGPVGAAGHTNRHERHAPHGAETASLLEDQAPPRGEQPRPADLTPPD